MKTNNIASYSDVLVTCMRQNPKWILLSEVRSAEAVMAVRNSISSGHYILSTIHADKAASIPNRMYSLLETNQDIEQFLKSIYRYIQIGVFIRGYQDKQSKKFVREIAEVTEFYVTEDNEARYNTIYKKTTTGNVYRKKPSKYLLDYLDGQGVVLPNTLLNEMALKEKEEPSTEGETAIIKNISTEKPVQQGTAIGNLNNGFINRPVNQSGINQVVNSDPNKVASLNQNVNPVVQQRIKVQQGINPSLYNQNEGSFHPAFSSTQNFNNHPIGNVQMQQNSVQSTQ